MNTANHLLLCNPKPNEEGYCTYTTIGDIIEIGGNKEIDVKLTLHTNISSVDNLNMQFLNLFKTVEFNRMITYGSIPTPIILRSEDIQLLIFGVLKYRGCTGLLTVQSSNNGTRYLFYVYDKLMHSATSFCTTCELIELDDVHKYFIDKIVKLNNQILEAALLVSFFNSDMVVSVVNYSKERFGIDK